MAKKIKFEVEIDDIKTSRIRNDSCTQSGEFEHNGETVKVSLTFSASFKEIFEEIFGDVGDTVTYSVVRNAQTTFGDHSEDPDEV